MKSGLRKDKRRPCVLLSFLRPDTRKKVSFLLVGKSLQTKKLFMYFQVSNEIVLIFLPKDALAACNYLPQSREKIIAALFKALNSTNSELQEAGEACMRKVSERDMSVCTGVCV